MKATLRAVWRCIALRALRVRTTYNPATETRLRNGATIVCANHVSFVDGLIIALASPVPPDLCLHTDFARQSRGARFGMGVMARMGFGGWCRSTKATRSGFAPCARRCCRVNP